MRRLARQVPQPILPDEFAKWKGALREGTRQYTQPAPDFPWMVQACPSGVTCPALVAKETSATLASAMAQLRRAESIEKDKKSDLDAAKSNLTHQGPAHHQMGLFIAARSALQDLKTLHRREECPAGLKD